MKSISPRDIETLYEVFLKRKPESDEAIEAKIKSYSNLTDLVRSFITSDEYREFNKTHKSVSYSDVILNNYFNSAGDIDFEISNLSIRDEIFARIKKQWTKLGNQEPYWSVLTESKFKKSVFDLYEAEFYESGIVATQLIDSLFKKNRISTIGGVCFELGCGVGRLTRFLAQTFTTVIAADISEGNISIAKTYMEKLGIHNVQFIKINSIEDFDQIEKFDFFFSLITLQHNPPPIQHYILDKMFSKLNRGGGFAFQTPTSLPMYTFDVDKYLSSPDNVMEMHALPLHAITSLCEDYRIPLIEIRPDNWTGSFGSNTFFGYGKKASN